MSEDGLCMRQSAMYIPAFRLLLHFFVRNGLNVVQVSLVFNGSGPQMLQGSFREIPLERSIQKHDSVFASVSAAIFLAQ